MRIEPIEPIYKAVNSLRQHPWKTGYCDGLFSRECNSPWKDGYEDMGKNQAYLRGFFAGKKERGKP